MHCKKQVGDLANNCNNPFLFIGFKLLGGTGVCCAILFVATVRAWRHIKGGGEKGEDDGQRKIKTAKMTTTTTTMDLEEGEMLSEGERKGKKDSLTCLKEQRPERVPLLGRTETEE